MLINLIPKAVLSFGFTAAIPCPNGYAGPILTCTFSLDMMKTQQPKSSLVAISNLCAAANYNIVIRALQVSVPRVSAVSWFKQLAQL
jgi:hypothetical protein